MAKSEVNPAEVSQQQISNLTMIRRAARQKAKALEKSRRIVVPKTLHEPMESMDLESFEYSSDGALDVQKAVLCVAYLLEFATDTGNEEVDGLVANGLSHVLRDSVFPRLENLRKRAEIEKREHDQGERPTG